MTSDKLQQLLPFYVTNSLDTEEANLVRTALLSDTDLQQEYYFLKKLHLAVKEQELPISPGEFGLARLQKEIAKSRQDTRSHPSAIKLNKQGLFWKIGTIAACMGLVFQTYNYQYLAKTDGLTAASGPVAHQEIPILQLTFTPEAREKHIRDLLLTLNISIIEGPSALGVYRVQVGSDLEKAMAVLEIDARIETLHIED